MKTERSHAFPGTIKNVDVGTINFVDSSVDVADFLSSEYNYKFADRMILNFESSHKSEIK